MPEKETYFKPNKLYDVNVKIKDLDYTNDTVEVSITSSLATAYQVIDLTFLLDPNDVIIEDIFGGEPIKLIVTLMREQDYPGPQFEVELMYLKSDFSLTQKSNQSRIELKDRTYFSITTVARNPFKSMSTFVNDVFIGTTLDDVITSLASDAKTNVTYDTNGRNTLKIDQLCVPPTTFYKIIKEYNRDSDDMFDGFLDQRFGLFYGTPGVFCQYNNKVYIKNLTHRIQKDQTFTVYQLSSGMSSKLIQSIYDEVVSGKTFYTYDIINTDYAGNARFADMGSTIGHIVKPKDTIASLLTQDLQSVGKNYSLFYSNKNRSFFIDEYAKRKKYYNEDTGYEDDSTLFDSRFGRSLSDLSTISLNLERNMPLLNLIEVGECVKFKPYTIEYQDFEGKYILWSSVITLQKQGPDWTSTARINLSRTNKKK